MVCPQNFFNCLRRDGVGSIFRPRSDSAAGKARLVVSGFSFAVVPSMNDIQIYSLERIEKNNCRTKTRYNRS